MEKIIKNNGSNAKGNIAYMMTSEFTEGFKAKRIAYLLKSKSGTDTLGNTFLTLYFKTSDGAIITGRQFNVQTTDVSSIIRNINKTIVDVEFIVQIYQGAYSLVVSSITSCNNIDPSPFFNIYKQAEVMFNLLSEKARKSDIVLQSNMVNSSLFQIDYGKIGGYIELVAMSYNIISIKQTEYLQDMLTCFFGIVNPYFSYLLFLEKEEFIPRKVTMELIQSVSVGDVRLDAIISDLLYSLTLEQIPEHFYSRIIYNAIQTAKEHLRLERLALSSPKDLVIQDGNNTLIYY